jgi:hypothetical protein
MSNECSNLVARLPPGPERHQGGESYRLEIVALSDDVPPINRLRLILKGLLRTYRFRCTSIAETTPRPEQAIAGDSKATDSHADGTMTIPSAETDSLLSGRLGGQKR